jgi:predicted transcriptional regulator
MISYDRYNAVLAESDAAVRQAAETAFVKLLEKIRAGTLPRTALNAILKEFNADAIEGFREALNAILETSMGPKAVKAYPVGRLKLSDVLYANAKAVTATTQQIIDQHLQGVHDARALAKALYEGYDFKVDPLKVVKPLPKYLQAEFDKFKAAALKTPALRAAYLEAIRKAEAGAGMDALEKALRTAFFERNRYYANRIARTELHRNYTDQQARELMREERIEYVQIRLSSKHPKTDICDLHAKLNKYGLGPGVYPKLQAPKPPFHPHCYCLCSPKIDLDPALHPKERPGAERAYLRSLPTKEGRDIAGSYEKRRRVLEDGDSLETIYNEGKDPLYKWKRLGNFEGFEARSERIYREQQAAYQKSVGLLSEAVRQDLFRMKDQAGWKEEGGHLLRDADGNAVGRTKWIAREQWFADYKAMHGGRGLTSSQMPQIIDQILKGKITKRGRAFLDWYEAYHLELAQMQESLAYGIGGLTPETKILLAELKQHFVGNVGECAESVLTGMTEEFYQNNPAATPAEHAEFLIAELKMWMEG